MFLIVILWGPMMFTFVTVFVFCYLPFLEMLDGQKCKGYVYSKTVLWYTCICKLLFCTCKSFWDNISVNEKNYMISEFMEMSVVLVSRGITVLQCVKVRM